MAWHSEPKPITDSATQMTCLGAVDELFLKLHQQLNVHLHFASNGFKWPLFGQTAPNITKLLAEGESFKAFGHISSTSSNLSYPFIKLPKAILGNSPKIAGDGCTRRKVKDSDVF